MIGLGPIDNFRGGYCWLSNSHPCLIVHNDIPFDSVEHAYQHAKFEDGYVRLAIRLARTAWVAKAEARRAEKAGLRRPDWEEVKLAVMLDLLRIKFTAHTDLQTRLLATGERELIEGNSWGDTFWGVCQGKGSNHLGRLLMQVREELRAGEGNDV